MVDYQSDFSCSSSSEIQQLDNSCDSNLEMENNIDYNKCMARNLNQRQCLRNKMKGSDYCSLHGKKFNSNTKIYKNLVNLGLEPYNWQKNGRIDEPYNDIVSKL